MMSIDADEELNFEFNNLPTGSGVQTERNSLRVFDRRAVSDWKRKENSFLEKHGNDATQEIIHYKKDG